MKSTLLKLMISDSLLKVKHVTIHHVLFERQERKGFELKLKEVTQKLDTLASKDDTSFDVLVRDFKASVMARNLDLRFCIHH